MLGGYQLLNILADTGMEFFSKNCYKPDTGIESDFYLSYQPPSWHEDPSLISAGIGRYIYLVLRLT